MSQASDMPRRLSTPTFRFLDLPVEVRNDIYRQVLPPQIAIASKEHAEAVRFLATSHQLRAEARSILYSESVFSTVIIPCLELYPVKEWTDVLEEEDATSIKHLVFEKPSPDFSISGLAYARFEIIRDLQSGSFAVKSEYVKLPDIQLDEKSLGFVHGLLVAFVLKMDASGLTPFDVLSLASIVVRDEYADALELPGLLKSISPFAAGPDTQ